MKSCDTCSHWRRYDIDNVSGWYDEDEPLKVNPDDFGECKAVTFAFWEKEGDKPFYVMDGSDYRATLTTRRDFACNQHNDSKDGETK